MSKESEVSSEVFAKLTGTIYASGILKGLWIDHTFVGGSDVNLVPHDGHWVRVTGKPYGCYNGCCEGIHIIKVLESE